MKLNRKWSLILGLVFLLMLMTRLMNGSIAMSGEDAAYRAGNLTGLFFFPLFFIVFAFLPKKDKKK